MFNGEHEAVLLQACACQSQQLRLLIFWEGQKAGTHCDTMQQVKLDRGRLHCISDIGVRHLLQLCWPGYHTGQLQMPLSLSRALLQHACRAKRHRHGTPGNKAKDGSDEATEQHKGKAA